MLRDEVSDVLREQLVQGGLQPGVRINETTLSRELGVSRTPLRESLLQMEKEGLVVAEPARGFTAAPLSAAEVRDVYPMVAALEGLAVRLCPPPDRATLDAAFETVRQLTVTERIEEARRLDNRFHEMLVEGCPNRRLVSLCHMLRRVTERYWMVFVAAGLPLQGSAAGHGSVLRALEGGDVELAARRLEAHWRDGMQGLVAHLEEGHAAG